MTLAQEYHTLTIRTPKGRLGRTRVEVTETDMRIVGPTFFTDQKPSPVPAGTRKKSCTSCRGRNEIVFAFVRWRGTPMNGIPVVRRLVMYWLRATGRSDAIGVSGCGCIIKLKAFVEGVRSLVRTVRSA